MAWRVKRHAEGRLDWLLNRAPESAAKATLAELRRGVGRVPGDLPTLWGMLLQDMPEDMYGKGAEPSRQEIAVYTALTLFAVHQQGWDLRRQPMHRADQSFGSAVAQLITPADDGCRERVERRFSQLVTSADMPEGEHRFIRQ